MFCPRCGSENVSDQKFCNKCGLMLGSVALAVEGRVDEAVTELDKAARRLNGTLKALGIFILFVLVSLLLNGQLGLFSFAASTAIGLVVALPFLITILAKLRRANGLLNGQVQPSRLAIGQSERLGAELPAATTNDLSLVTTEVSGSVTEPTTQALKRPGHG